MKRYITCWFIYKLIEKFHRTWSIIIHFWFCVIIMWSAHWLWDQCISDKSQIHCLNTNPSYDIIANYLCRTCIHLSGVFWVFFLLLYPTYGTVFVQFLYVPCFHFCLAVKLCCIRSSCSYPILPNMVSWNLIFEFHTCWL